MSFITDAPAVELKFLPERIKDKVMGTDSPLRLRYPFPQPDSWGSGRRRGSTLASQIDGPRGLDLRMNTWRCSLTTC